MEILLELGGKIIKFPCQAKIVYATRRYGALRHKVGNTYQIELLIRYAQRIGGYPLYLFYNYDQYLTDELLELTNGSEQLWGCSFGSAEKIKEQFFGGYGPTPLFRDLHPGICWPLYMLFESLAGRAKGRMLSDMLPGFTLSKLKTYSLTEILQDPLFKDVSPAGSLGKIDNFDQAPYKIDNKGLMKDQPAFNPRFRILITAERIKGTLIGYLS